MTSSVSTTSSSKRLEAILNNLPSGVDTPTIQNIPLLASTETPVSFSSTTVAIKFKARTCATLQYAYVLGESSTKYITVDAGNEVELPLLVDSTTPTLYIQSDVATTLEVESWA